RGVETARGEHGDQQLILSLPLAIEELRRLIDAFAARLVDEQLAVNELLQKLRTDGGFVRTLRHLGLAQCEIELGKRDFRSVYDCDGLALSLALATRQQNSTNDDCRNDWMLHFPAPLIN